jgi:hypothetical protein
MTVTSTGPNLIRTHHGARGSGISRFLRGPGTDPRWARPPLLELLALTALLYMVGLDATAGRTTFYAAAVQACTKN